MVSIINFMYQQFGDDHGFGLGGDDDQFGNMALGDDEEKTDEETEDDEYGVNSDDKDDDEEADE